MAVFTAQAQQVQKALGIDVYENTGIITWSTVKSDGISFAWAKATEGTYYEDTNFVRNQVNGKAAGVYMGAYHFCRPDLDAPATEANYFWNFAKNNILNDGKTLMPVLDFETFNGVVGASSYADWVNQWCHDVQTNAAAAGVKVTPIVYCSACSGACDLNSSDTNWGNWIADYNGEGPQTNTPWTTCQSCDAWDPSGLGHVWSFWQYSSSGTLSGVPGTYTGGLCDEDVYNGTTNQLVSSFVVGTIDVTGTPTNTTVNAGDTATFTVAATSSAGALAYQWRFNQANIPGATTNIYSITNAQIANAGAYSVLMTNNNSSILSGPAFLSVLGPLVNAPGYALDPSNMISWWTGDGNVNDIYNITNNLIPNGGLAYTNGKVGLAFRFDGSSAYLNYSVANNGGEMASPWTVCAWVYRQNASGVSAALMGDGTYAVKVQQYSHTGDVGISKSQVADYYFNVGLTVNAWSHLAITYNGSQIQLYINGVLATSQLYSNSVAIPTPSGLELPRQYIGVDTFSGSPSDYILGALDEIQVYSRALSSSEIASIYYAGSAGLVRAPQFTSVTNLGNGSIQFNLVGQTGKAIRIFSSTDLVNWTIVESILNPPGATNYTDTSASTTPQKFYQATQRY